MIGVYLQRYNMIFEKENVHLNFTLESGKSNVFSSKTLDEFDSIHDDWSS